MEPEKKRVSSRVRVEPIRPESDPKTWNFSGFLKIFNYIFFVNSNKRKSRFLYKHHLLLKQINVYLKNFKKHENIGFSGQIRVG